MKRKLYRKLIDFTGKELLPGKIDYCLIEANYKAKHTKQATVTRLLICIQGVLELITNN